MKGEINNNTIIIGDFNTLLISMDTLSERKSIKKKNTPALKRHIIPVSRYLQDC